MMLKGMYSASNLHMLLDVFPSCRLSIILRTLGFPAVPLHGQLSQSQRLGALNKFKTGGRRVLVATDVASRYVYTVTRHPFNELIIGQWS